MYYEYTSSTKAVHSKNMQSVSCIVQFLVKSTKCELLQGENIVGELPVLLFVFYQCTMLSAVSCLRKKDILPAH
jgi:hypothetical protein